MFWRYPSVLPVVRLALFALAFLAGVYLGDRLHLPASGLWLFALASAAFSILLISLRKSPLPAVLLMLVVLGALRMALSGFDGATALAAYHSRGLAEVEGVVAGEPEPAGMAVRFRFALDRIRAGSQWEEASGDVLVTLNDPAELVQFGEPPYLRYGDRLLLEGIIEAPPKLDGFDYPAYLARQGLGSVMSFPAAALLAEGEGFAFHRRLQQVRQALAGSLEKAVPEPHASVGQAVLLGIKDGLPVGLVSDFRRTGTSHLLAISGLHVGVVLAIGLSVSQWAFGRRRQYYLISPLVLVWLYALLAGMSPSAARAAIMGTVYLAALAVGRPRSVLPALGLAAALMVALDPRVLWSVSFQLSFAAMAGLAALAEPLRTRLRAQTGQGPEDSSGLRAVVSPAADVAAMTAAATFATLPLVAFYFQQVSLVGLPATLLALPALPLVLVSHGTTALVGLVASPLAVPFGWLAWASTAYLTFVVSLFARLPAASFETGQVAPFLAWAYYSALLLVWMGRSSLAPRVSSATSAIRTWVISRRRNERTVPWWVLGPAAAVPALVWLAALSVPDGKLHVMFAEVGQGDAILITTPRGGTILVDGGPDPLEASRLLGSRLPFWDRSVDLVVLTHAHADHATGLTEVLRRYDVHRVLERSVIYDSSAYDAWRRAVDAEEAEVIQARAGLQIALDDGIYVEVVSPPEILPGGTASDVDNASVVLRLVYGQASFLLTGDVFAEAESALVFRGAVLDSDVLKVAHHGSKTSSSRTFLKEVSPVIAVISAGEDNRFGHPHPETLQALLQHMPREQVLTTVDHGNIEVITDGTTLQVKTAR